MGSIGEMRMVVDVIFIPLSVHSQSVVIPIGSLIQTLSMLRSPGSNLHSK